jgi:hypothetical protein
MVRLKKRTLGCARIAESLLNHVRREPSDKFRKAGDDVGAVAHGSSDGIKRGAQLVDVVQLLKSS